jgi:hypothetical protein
MDRARPPSTWRCLAVVAEGDNAEEKADDLARYLHGQLTANRPDFAAIEMPQRSVTRFERKRTDLSGERTDLTINPNALQLSALAGAVVAILSVHDVPFGLVAPGTWRSAYFGKGWKPADGDWKAAAVRMAEAQNILLPETLRASRDAAESAGVAVAWQSCTFVPKRHQAAFMALRAGRVAA